MLTKDEVKTILKKNHVNYTEEEISQVIKLLDVLVEIQLRIDQHKAEKLKSPWKK